MNNALDNEIVVNDIAGRRAVIECRQAGRCDQLAELGFIRESDSLVRNISSDLDREQLVKKLIEMKVLFSSGRDWSPAELVDYYREKGIIAGGYRILVWKGPGKFLIEERGN